MLVKEGDAVIRELKHSCDVRIVEGFELRMQMSKSGVRRDYLYEK